LAQTFVGMWLGVLHLRTGSCSWPPPSGSVPTARRSCARTGSREVTSWRFNAAAYRAAAAARSGRELTGPAVTACWAPDLTVAMSELARRVEEELVLDDLLDDLATWTSQ
jgi:hypothetical protein